MSDPMSLYRHLSAAGLQAFGPTLHKDICEQDDICGESILQIDRLMPSVVAIDATGVFDWLVFKSDADAIPSYANTTGFLCPWPAVWIGFSFDGRNQGLLVEAVQADEGGQRITIWGPFYQWHFPHSGVVLTPPIGAIRFPVDSQGSIDWQEIYYAPAIYHHGVEAFWESESKPALHNALLAATWTFVFANCKNVELREVSPSRQQRRLAERQGKPLYVHHTLVINSNVTRTVAEGAKKQAPQHIMRQHICRGHFATYSEDRPLFGRYAGRFWIPAHVKGNPERGFVDKDYVAGQVDVPE